MADFVINARFSFISCLLMLATQAHAAPYLAKVAATGEEVISYDGGRFVIVGADPRACVVAVQGLISHDTSFKFDDVVAKTTKLGCERPWLLLESPGGRLLDGIAIGREIHFRNFRTVTRAECASACALMFLGGVDRALLGPRAKIGFHQVASMSATPDSRHCSSSSDDNGVREMRRYVKWVAGDNSDAIMHLIMETSCNTIEWTSGQRALDLGVATRLESGDVSGSGAGARPQ